MPIMRPRPARRRALPRPSKLANLAGPTLGEVLAQAHRGIQRIRTTPHLAYSFLRHTGLSVA